MSGILLRISEPIDLSMKNYFLILSLAIIFAGFYSNAQVPPSYSVTITPNSTTTDVKGNIKGNGLIEANTLKATGLATGNPFVANPVYANAYGDLITGYKVGYLGIPAAAFHLSLHAYIYNNEYTFIPDGNDYLQYDGRNIVFINSSPSRAIIAPIQVPHKSKLTSMKISFSSYFDAKSLDVSIIRSSLLQANDQTILHSLTTAVTNTNQLVTEVVFPNSLEIDNQNYLYTLKIGSTSNNWAGVYFKGVIIEYHDF